MVWCERSENKQWHMLSHDTLRVVLIWTLAISPFSPHNNGSGLLGSAFKTVLHLSLRVKINTVSETSDPHRDPRLQSYKNQEESQSLPLGH